MFINIFLFIAFVKIFKGSILKKRKKGKVMCVDSLVNVQRTVPGQKGLHCALLDHCQKDSGTLSAAKMTAS